jgi:hypothetical protein
VKEIVMSKLREDIRVGMLGAAAGLFSVSVCLMIARIDAYYAFLSWVKETTEYVPYDRGVEDLWWIPVTIWHLTLSITASLLVHRHLTTRLRSPFLLWQVIGITSLLGWGLTVLLVVSLDCLMSGNLFALERLIYSEDIVNVAKYVSAGWVSNVFYSSVMKASSRQYSAQFDELACESSSVDHLLTSSQVG